MICEFLEHFYCITKSHFFWRVSLKTQHSPIDHDFFSKPWVQKCLKTTRSKISSYRSRVWFLESGKRHLHVLSHGLDPTTHGLDSSVERVALVLEVLWKEVEGSNPGRVTLPAEIFSFSNKRLGCGSKF